MLSSSQIPLPLLCADGATTEASCESVIDSNERLTPRTAMRRRMSWAELMKRVFEVDVLECPVCKGPMRIIAEITDRKVIQQFLTALDLPSEAPEIQRARPPPQTEFDWDNEVDMGAADDGGL